jgi:hypothetical protein
MMVLFSVGRMAWRMVVRNEEIEPGGSDGRQMVDRAKL